MGVVAMNCLYCGHPTAQNKVGGYVACVQCESELGKSAAWGLPVLVVVLFVIVAVLKSL
jgi:hypothetical protein